MRLADFILRDMGAILANWEASAATRVPAAASMSSLALRDHAQQILQAVAKDLSTAQTEEAQEAKSLGLASTPFPARETAAQTHAILRARSGFDINQLTAEYRALRASVLRLWTDACQAEDRPLEDVIRFNESIDQALAESVSFFSAQVDQARNLLLGMLSHDMRSPLQTILAAASYLAALNAGIEVSQAAARLINGGARMKALLDDLLDFNRTRLGFGINIAPTDVDLEALFAHELDQVRAIHPDRRVELKVVGSVRGTWDGRRLQQLLANLVLNAIKYGLPEAPVRVFVTGGEADVRIEVRNSGTPIERPTLDESSSRSSAARIMSRVTTRTVASGWVLAAALYIAREIAKAHGGQIEARSDETETAFAVRLPRHRESHS